MTDCWHQSTNMLFHNSNQTMDDCFYVERVEDEEFWVLKRYVNVSRIGRGAQSLVVQAYDQIEGRHVAIKKISNFSNELNAKRTYREFCLLQSINHCNIIKLLNAYTPQQNANEFSDIYLVTEYVENNLTEAIELELGHEEISFILYQMLCGIHHLQKSGIIHRDLKPSNIMIDNQLCLKIIDFGLAKSQNENFLEQTPYVVSRHYRAPEIIFGMDYDKSVDIWSIGCILAEMITKDFMFPGSDSMNQWRVIVEKLGRPTANFIKNLQPGVRNFAETPCSYATMSWEILFPNEIFPQKDANSGILAQMARDLLSKMLVIDPSQRITIEEALMHPYVSHWYKADEINVQVPRNDEFCVEHENYMTDDWKTSLFKKLQLYKSQHDIFGNLRPSHDYNFVPQTLPIQFDSQDLRQTQHLHQRRSDPIVDFDIMSCSSYDSGFNSVN